LRNENTIWYYKLIKYINCTCRLSRASYTMRKHGHLWIAKAIMWLF